MGALEDLGKMDEARRIGEEAARIAGQVLEKRPNHMNALRSRALITSSLSEIEGASLNERKSLAYSLPSMRDWRDYLRLDPGNAIAWNNLTAAATRAADSLDGLGRTSESLAQWRAILAAEKQGKFQRNSYFGMMNAAGNMAELLADSGRESEARAILPEVRRFEKIAVQDLPLGTWNRVGGEEYAVILESAVEEASGNYAAARQALQGSLKRFVVLKPSNALETRQRSENAARMTVKLARLSYLLRDYAAAEAYSRESIAFGKQLPIRSPRDQEFASEAPILLSLSLARQGRLVEARQAIEPVLKLHGTLRAKGSDNLFQQRLMAAGLLAAALAWPAEAQPRLAEAAAILDAFPEEAKRRRSNKVLRELIAQEQRRR
jgi:hypothetical protein